MKWLLLDTALDACTVVIAEGDAVRVEQRGAGGKGHAERLLPTIEAARQAAGIALSDIDAIAATIGPGSFTGIRTALSVARGLSLALRRPLWGLSTTAALGWQGAEAGRATVAVIDARREEVYLQAFAPAAEGLGAALAEPALLRLDQADAALPGGPLTLVGSGAHLLEQKPERRVSPAPVSPNAASLLHFATLAAGAWRPGDALPIPPKPLYIRPPDAALPKVVQPAATLAVRLEPAGAALAAVMSQLHREGFHDGWDEAALVQLLTMPGAFALLALDGADQPAGFALGRVAADEAEVISITVRPRLRRLGIGGVLLRGLRQQAAARQAKTLFLEVAESNIAAQALYRSAGFNEVGRRKDYYEVARITPDTPVKREAALVMRADIAPV